MAVCTSAEVLYCANENTMNPLFPYVTRATLIPSSESSMFFIKFMKKFSWSSNSAIDMDVVSSKIKTRSILHDGDTEIMIKKIIYSKISKDFHATICQVKSYI